MKAFVAAAVLIASLAVVPHAGAAAQSASYWTCDSQDYSGQLFTGSALTDTAAIQKSLAACRSGSSDPRSCALQFCFRPL